MEGPVLGLDLGARRIGMAISDPGTDIAFPAGHLLRKDLAKDLEALRALADERGISRIVVGLPLHMDGRRGKAAEAARAFAESLAKATDLPVDTFDERLTTVEAERALRGAPAAKRKRRKEVIDSMAATLILRTYLESRSGTNPGETR
jgi:putative Holliday junction resolvase